jgi:hypothetical protein
MLLSAFTMHAENEFTPNSVFKHLTTGERAAFTLETNWQSLADNRKTDKGFSGTLSAADGQVFQVDLKTKGRFRRQYGVIAPLKIKFAKKALVAAGLDTFNEFKVIFPFTNDAAGEACIIREYLIYQMFERLSPYHVKARLATVRLKDKHSDKEHTYTCLLLEDKEETVARLSGKLTDNFDNKESDLDPDQYAKVVLFEYMIGNTDWDIHTTRNLRILKHPGHDKLVAIPYDFDFSGFVNAPYAVPSADFKLKSIRDRYFMAEGLSAETIRKAARQFRDERESFMALCRESGLPEKAVKDMTGYLESFFKAMESGGDLPKGYRAQSK